jgi:hypothetical protein
MFDQTRMFDDIQLLPLADETLEAVLADPANRHLDQPPAPIPPADQ